MWFEQTTPYMISRKRIQTGGERGQEATGGGEGGSVSAINHTEQARDEGRGVSTPDSRTDGFPTYPRSGRGPRCAVRFSTRKTLPCSAGRQTEARSPGRSTNAAQQDAVSLSKETSAYGYEGKEEETFGKKSDPQPASSRPRRTQTRFFRRGGTSTGRYCALPSPPVSSERPANRAIPSPNASPAASHPVRCRSHKDRTVFADILYLIVFSNKKRNGKKIRAERRFFC